MTTREQRYISLRLRGASDTDACELAGYASRPPGRVRRLYERAAKLKLEPELCGRYAQLIAKKEKELSELKELQKLCGV